jgi:glycosyltransferase involved in cell wall biosynthesis
MKVLFLPYYRTHNPYQRRLATALQKCGVEVLDVGIRYFPIIGAVHACRPDVLHLHWVGLFFVHDKCIKKAFYIIRSVAELLAVRLRGVKIVWTIHNLYDHERRVPMENVINRFIVHLSEQLIVHYPFGINAVMRAYDLPEKCRKKINVIPHGHYIDSYDDRIVREEARSVLGLREKEKVFLYFGSIRPYKGVASLIHAFQELQCREVSLVIAGACRDDVLKEQLIKQCRTDSRIHTFLEDVPDEKIPLFMNAADVVVLPFKDIFTSGSVILAMSFQKAVIAPSIGCVPEVLDKDGAFLYDPADERNLPLAMKGALEADLVKMGRHNYEHAKRFDWTEIAEQTYDVYRQCANTSPCAKYV